MTENIKENNKISPIDRISEKLGINTNPKNIESLEKLIFIEKQLLQAFENKELIKYFTEEEILSAKDELSKLIKDTSDAQEKIEKSKKEIRKIQFISSCVGILSDQFFRGFLAGVFLLIFVKILF